MGFLFFAKEVNSNELSKSSDLFSRVWSGARYPSPQFRSELSQQLSCGWKQVISNSSLPFLTKNGRGRLDDLFLLCVTSKLIMSSFLISPLNKESDTALKHRGRFLALPRHPFTSFHRLYFHQLHIT